jgi:hypothetical protein
MLKIGKADVTSIGGDELGTCQPLAVMGVNNGNIRRSNL